MVRRCQRNACHCGAPFYGDHGNVALDGDTLYLISYNPSDFSPQISRISFDSGGQLTIEALAIGSLRNITALSSFAGGVLFVADLPGDFANRYLQWYDPASGTTSTLATAPQFGPVTVTAGPNGTQNAFFYKKPAYNTNTLAAINSATLGQPNPQATDLKSFGTNVLVGEDYSSWQPLLAADEHLVFSATTTVSNVSTVQFWTSDGTVAGTLPLGQTFDPHGYFRDQVIFAGHLYLISQPQIGDGSDESPAGRLYKLDLGTGEFTLLNEFFGGDNYSALSYQQIFVADDFYFVAMSPDKSYTALWRLGANDATATYVPAKPTNVYSTPDLQNAVYAGGKLYFSAQAYSILNSYSEPTNQVWSVGAPGAVPVPGDLNGDGSVTASDIDSIWGLIQSGDSSAGLESRRIG